MIFQSLATVFRRNGQSEFLSTVPGTCARRDKVNIATGLGELWLSARDAHTTARISECQWFRHFNPFPHRLR